MGRAPCCDKANVKKGPWSPEEDLKLKEYIEKYGTGGNWIALPQKAGLRRCGKSCRLRWLNYLRPNIKHGEFSDDEDRVICALFASIGSRWSIIAAQLPGRTDNDIKNYWNTKLKKKLMGMMPPHSQRIKPHTFSSLLHTPSSSLSSPYSPALSSSSYKCNNTTTSCFYYNSSTTLEPPLISSIPSSTTLLNSTTSTATYYTNLQQPQESFMGLMHHHHNNQVKDHTTTSLLMFGGDQTSCTSTTSSDEYGEQQQQQQQMGNFPSYFYNNNGVEDENHNKFMLSNGANGWSHEKPNGMWGESSTTSPILDYGFEEIKQLISTNICNNFLVDESKTEERGVMMYY